MSSTSEMKPGRGKSIKALQVLLAPKKKLVSISRRTGLVFPVARAKRYMRKYMTVGQRVNTLAAITLTATLEYLVAELLNIAIMAKDLSRKRHITPRSILLAINEDDEFYCLLRGVTITDGGAAPFVHADLKK